MGRGDNRVPRGPRHALLDLRLPGATLAALITGEADVETMAHGPDTVKVEPEYKVKYASTAPAWSPGGVFRLK